MQVSTGGSAGCNAGRDEDQAALRTLAEWLRALRKALCLLPVHDAATPLRVLAAQGERLLALSRAAPAEAAEVVQQLARWQQAGCEKELATLLRPMLGCLFAAPSREDSMALLPLLSDLAAGCWPRAVMGDLDLDWHAIAMQALAALRIAIEGDAGDGGEGEASDAEAALAVWQTFAVTVREGAHAEPDMLEELPALAGSKVERPEKRSRLCEDGEWRASPERIVQCEALPQLFGSFAREVLELLQVPPEPEDVEALLGLRDVRAAAQTTLTSWALLVGESSAWREAAWHPLQQVGTRLTASAGTALTEDVWREAEAVLWFSAALVESWPAVAASSEGVVPLPAAAVLGLSAALDSAPESWRVLLWSAACSLAATAPAEHCTKVMDWALQRPPMAVCAPGLLQLVELPYAEALERLCRHLPALGAANALVGERLAALAFEGRSSAALHADSVKCQGLMLRAMRHAMGSDAALLCKGLVQGVMPSLCQAVEAESQAAPTEADPQWRAAQALFATLAASLPEAATPSADPPHPAVAVWRDRWPYVEAALLRWPPSSSCDQPLTAAAEALTAAVQVLPALLPGALQLLAKSAAQHELPQIQLQALREVTAGAQCTSVDSTKLPELLAGTVLMAVDAILARQDALVAHPPTLSALFKLLSVDHVRPLLLVQTPLTGRCLGLMTRALPECSSPDAAAAMLRFAACLVGSREELAAQAAHRSMLVAGLPELCGAVAQALAAQEHLTELEEGLLGAAELLLRCAEALPDDFPGALAAGLGRAQVSESSSGRVQRHVGDRAEWPKRGEWLGQLQQIVCELQRERRRVMF
mmetsp:Transcript_66265/g.188169  ORF Transcript_66265/g.188169 Transcript_66265/m.188169 type:complete len:821 (-) Transcript_66265:477-2939(-)